MEKTQPETVAPQATSAQLPTPEPPAYFAAPVNPPAQTQQQVAEIQPEVIQQQPQLQQPLPETYTTKHAQAMDPHYNGVPLVTPLEMLQGETPQYIDCPWCQQRALATASRHGTSMQMLTGLICCLICVCLACVPCIAGWFEETEYNCSACKRLVAKRDDNGAIQLFVPPVLVPSHLPAQPQPVHPAPAQQQQQQEK
ncbi:hypothetical protein B0T16DRAFT_418130 [Cercophora newfieldiana]|uniref:LITAF domain-containing protein n=1 Tax=Cercophora newfieldiana TaxID=92897 RepID=A0AA39XUP3_9PEZI|nr:hypothetical protein B0T16DRAFT_418130 [Cercophora newfieldiana]